MLKVAIFISFMAVAFPCWNECMRNLFSCTRSDARSELAILASNPEFWCFGSLKRSHHDVPLNHCRLIVIGIFNAVRRVSQYEIVFLEGFFCWLIFTLIDYALPFVVGLAAGMGALTAAQVSSARLSSALPVAYLTLFIGQVAFASVRPPILRAVIGGYVDFR
jgi:hypothetical protein